MSQILQLWEGLTGAIIPFAGASAPDGFVVCHGQVVARATYPGLFAVIGTTYNTSGEAGAQFRLPDLRGEFLRGLDAGRGVDPGRTLGSWQKATAVSFDMAPESDPTVDSVRGTREQIGGDITLAGDYVGTSLSYNNDVASQAGFSNPAGTRPRNVAINYIIKT